MTQYDAQLDALRPLAVGAALAAVAVALTSTVAVAVAGERALAGALVGGLAVLGVLLFGVVTLAAVVRVAPGMALLVAMTTYLLQVMVLLSIYMRYQRDAAMQDAISAGWLAGGIVAATVAWLTGHVVAAYRSRHVAEPWEPVLDEEGDDDATL